MGRLVPMLLTRAGEWPAGGDWALEPKWDGYRLVASVEGGRARCWTRHGTELTSRLGTVAGELVELLPDRSVIDGELVALARGPGGEPGQDFNRLSRTIFGRGDDNVCFVVFDAPQLAGKQLAGLAWDERRSALEQAVPAPGATVSVIDVFDADPAVHARLLALGFEGSVLKRRDGRYLPGRRSRAWRKLKTRSSSAAVVEVAQADRLTGVVERVGCRAADDPDRLTWAVVWSPLLRAHLTGIRAARSDVKRSSSTRTARSPARYAKHA